MTALPYDDLTAQLARAKVPICWQTLVLLLTSRASPRSIAHPRYRRRTYVDWTSVRSTAHCLFSDRRTDSSSFPCRFRRGRNRNSLPAHASLFSPVTSTSPNVSRELPVVAAQPPTLPTEFALSILRGDDSRQRVNRSVKSVCIRSRLETISA